MKKRPVLYTFLASTVIFAGVGGYLGKQYYDDYQHEVRRIKHSRTERQSYVYNDDAKIAEQINQSVSKYLDDNGKLKNPDEKVPESDIQRVAKQSQKLSDKDQTTVGQLAKKFDKTAQLNNAYIDLWVPDEVGHKLANSTTPTKLYQFNAENSDTLDELSALDNDDQYIDFMSKRMNTLGKSANETEQYLHDANTYFKWQKPYWQVNNHYLPDNREDMLTRYKQFTYEWPTLSIINRIVLQSNRMSQENVTFADKLKAINEHNEQKARERAEKQASERAKSEAKASSESQKRAESVSREKAKKQSSRDAERAKSEAQASSESQKRAESSSRARSISESQKQQADAESASKQRSESAAKQASEQNENNQSATDQSSVDNEENGDE